MENDILVKPNRDPLFGFTRQELINTFRSVLRGRVTAAYFFGSFACDNLRPNSDIDIILVTRTKLPFIERPRLFDDLRDLIPALDVLVYTPEEFDSLTNDPSPGFWQSVVKTMVRIL